jgi:octopine/nopaline transport system permease protein
MFLADTMVKLLAGVPLTLELTFISVGLGACLAVLLAVLRASVVIGAWLVRLYVFALRGTPLLLQIFLIYYGLGQFAFIRESVLWPFLRQPFWCAILALTMNTAAYGSEIIRGGLQSVPPGAIEAARVSGMSGVLLYRRIILPLAIRQALPAYSNELIAMVKATSLASIITLMEISGIAYAIISETYRALEVFICAGALYLLINFLLSRAVAALETWLTPHLRQARA